MNWLIFLFAIELGYNPAGVSVIWNEDYKESRQEITNTYYSQFEGELILFEHIGIGSTIKVNSIFKNLRNWAPFSIDFLTRVRFFYDDFEIGARFFCGHPIQTWSTFDTDHRMEGWYSQLYARYEAKIGDE